MFEDLNRHWFNAFLQSHIFTRTEFEKFQCYCCFGGCIAATAIIRHVERAIFTQFSVKWKRTDFRYCNGCCYCNASWNCFINRLKQYGIYVLCKMLVPYVNVKRCTEKLYDNTTQQELRGTRALVRVRVCVRLRLFYKINRIINMVR